jgi:monothiol glutaredoxin
MKGSPSAPMCGFSFKVVQILNALGVDYQSYNVLADENLRQGIKQYSNWPTIPQLYVKGEFVGGCDIIENMYRSGELQALLSSYSKNTQSS